MSECLTCHTQNEHPAQICAGCGRTLPLPAGTLIAKRYEIQAVIGRGGMGMVYRVRDQTLEETVALKVLRADLTEGELARRFRSEIKVARRVGHRNVCRVFEYGEDGAIRYIAMELVDGQNLRHLVAHSGPLSQSEAFEAAIQAVSGLEAIHELGFVHRDIKSANIMRDERGVVKLMDFGIAKAGGHEGGDITSTGGVVGTPEYMSPEQAQAEKIDARSDIYSMGIVVHEIFTGVVPFRGDTPIASILKHIHEPFEPSDQYGLPRAVCSVLERCLAKRPADRFASAHELLQALERAREECMVEQTDDRLPVLDAPLLDDDPTQTVHAARLKTRGGVTLRPDAADTEKASVAPMRRWRVAALAAVGIAGLGTAAYFALRHGEPPPVSESPSTVSASAPATPLPVHVPQHPPSETPLMAVPEPSARPQPPVPSRDTAQEIAAQVARARRLGAEAAYGQLLILASRHPDDASVREELHAQRRRLVEHWVGKGREALGQAASGATLEPYTRAAAYFERALELDPSNGDAQGGRAAALRGSTSTPPGAPSDRVAFVMSETNFNPSPMAGAPAGMGALPPGMEVRPAQPPAPQARIAIEIEPQPLRPGEAYTARYFVFNQSQGTLNLMAASIKNLMGSSASTGGRVELKSKLAPPNTRTLLLETKDTWRLDPSVAWSTTLTLVLDDGSVYSGTLHSKR
jgi:serine/threonine protein kinase